MLSFLFKFSVSAAIVYLLIHFNKLDPSAVWEALSDLRLATVLLALGVLFSLLKACRLLVILKGTGFDVRLPFCAKLIFASYYFDLFGIGQVGGLASRFYYLSKASEERRSVIASVLLGEVAIGAYTIFLFASVMLAFQDVNDPLVTRLLSLCLVVSVLSPIFIYLKNRLNFRLPEAVRSALDGLARLTRSPKLLAYAVILTFIEYSVKALSLYAVALSFQPVPNTNFPQIGVIFSLGALVSVLPIGIAGAGPGHLGYQFLWEKLSRSKSSFGSDLFSMFWYQNLMLAAIGMMIVLFDRRAKNFE